MTRKKRALALFLSAFLTFVLFFSVLYIAEEAHHDCTGDNCPICRELEICAQTLSLLSAATTAAVLSVAVFRTVSEITYNISDSRQGSSTLVGQKIRMND